MNCPHCQQRMLVRHGVALSPREADLFDLIAARALMPMDALGWVWAGVEKSTKAQANLVKTTVYHINNKFAATDIRIKGQGKHPVFYWVVGV